MTDSLTTALGHRFEYIVGDDAWYAEANRHFAPDPYLTISKVAANATWEFQIVDRTRTIGEPAIQVRIFHDAFAAFTDIAAFFTALDVEHPTTLDQVRNILDRLGFVDATARVNPHADRRAAQLREEAARLLAEADKLTPKE